jgi:endonuclease YncB( thermonuclease family)
MSSRLVCAAPLLALVPLAALAATPHPATADRETARFALCSGPHRVTCVVDGDTFWYRGAKVRLADINAPEVSEPGCTREAELGHRATDRFLALLNAGPFTLAANGDGTGRDHDRYGRLLRTVTRGGASVGEELVREGLAEQWKGRRGNWC